MKKKEGNDLSEKALPTQSIGLFTKPLEQTPETSVVDEGNKNLRTINLTKDEDEVNKEQSVKVTANAVTNPTNNDGKVVVRMLMNHYLMSLNQHSYLWTKQCLLSQEEYA